MNRQLFPVIALALGVLAPGAHAGAIADRAAEAEQLAAAGKYIEADDALAAASEALRAAMPLSIRRALFVVSEPGGFGVYNPRETSVYKIGEPMIVYAEPIGYGYRKDGELNVLAIGVDVIVKDKAGNEVASQKDFGELSFQSRYQNREFFAKVTYSFTGLPAGDYQVTTVLRDKVTEKTVDFTLPFSIAE